MAYIIENAHILKKGELKETSLLVENNKILSSRPAFKLYKHIRMNAADYIMTPTHVKLDFNLPLSQTFAQRKAYYLRQFILKGCTTVLTCASIDRERELTSQLKKTQTELLDCPIDFVLGVRIRPSLLTPRFIRACKREKVPAIFVEINHRSELTTLPWGWIKEAMFPYNSPLIPIFAERNIKLGKLWSDLMDASRIPSLKEEMNEDVPLNRTVMEKIGIFPKKSYLHDGGEVSYNFYLKDNENVKIVESDLFMKHESSLLVTVHKGKVIRAGSCLNYRPGYGEHVRINTPAFYLSPT